MSILSLQRIEAWDQQAGSHDNLRDTQCDDQQRDQERGFIADF
jgi:hypothetical protein